MQSSKRYVWISVLSKATDNVYFTLLKVDFIQVWNLSFEFQHMWLEGLLNGV
jgi:hypothetical protein